MNSKEVEELNVAFDLCLYICFLFWSEIFWISDTSQIDLISNPSRLTWQSILRCLAHCFEYFFRIYINSMQWNFFCATLSMLTYMLNWIKHFLCAWQIGTVEYFYVYTILCLVNFHLSLSYFVFCFCSRIVKVFFSFCLSL